MQDFRLALRQLENVPGDAAPNRLNHNVANSSPAIIFPLSESEHSWGALFCPPMMFSARLRSQFSVIRYGKRTMQPILRWWVLRSIFKAILSPSSESHRLDFLVTASIVARRHCGFRSPPNR